MLQLWRVVVTCGCCVWLFLIPNSLIIDYEWSRSAHQLPLVHHVVVRYGLEPFTIPRFEIITKEQERRIKSK
jgi:hypothetical protein